MVLRTFYVLWARCSTPLHVDILTDILDAGFLPADRYLVGVNLIAQSENLALKVVWEGTATSGTHSVLGL